MSIALYFGKKKGAEMTSSEKLEQKLKKINHFITVHDMSKSLTHERTPGANLVVNFNEDVYQVYSWSQFKKILDTIDQAGYNPKYIEERR
ncbi:hypothetical protein J4474_02920 [Candidatus Pacearchaeota archaeon]|nr:hypothetical protein [Candidatus Pacearchaeota archaeon]